MECTLTANIFSYLEQQYQSAPSQNRFVDLTKKALIGVVFLVACAVSPIFFAIDLISQMCKWTLDDGTAPPSATAGTGQSRSEGSFLDFYRGLSPDAHGVTIEQIWAYSSDELERHHNFIQWLFPNTNRGAYNPRAPVITREIAQAFRSDPELRRRMLRSLEVMLRFLGLELQENPTRIVRAQDFESRRQNWMDAHPHNLLRITRMIASLGHLGFPEHCAALCSCMGKF